MTETDNHNDCPELSDEQLVAQTLEDRDRFSCLMRRYEARLFRYIQRISSLRKEDAEDVLQDAFISAYRNLHDFDPDRGKFSTWMYRIARNAAISAVRKLKVKQKYLVPDIGEDLIERIASDADIARDADRGFDSAIVRATLDGLKDDQREILLLHYLEGMGYIEISDILHVAPGTVGSRLSRAKQAFQKLYRPDARHDATRL